MRTVLGDALNFCICVVAAALVAAVVMLLLMMMLLNSSCKHYCSGVLVNHMSHSYSVPLSSHCCSDDSQVCPKTLVQRSHRCRSPPWQFDALCPQPVCSITRIPLFSTRWSCTRSAPWVVSKVLPATCRIRPWVIPTPFRRLPRCCHQAIECTSFMFASSMHTSCWWRGIHRLSRTRSGVCCTEVPNFSPVETSTILLHPTAPRKSNKSRLRAA